MTQGKKFKAAAAKVDTSRLYDVPEAVGLVKSAAFAKFNETVELALRLGVDPKHADQMVRGTVVLPHGLGKVLGPRGLMPNPKAGTVTFDVGKAVKELKAGKIEFRVDKTAIIHCPVGKVSFEAKQLVENTEALLYAVARAKPAAAKGKYVKSVFLSSSMGPGIPVDPAAAEKVAGGAS